MMRLLEEETIRRSYHAIGFLTGLPSLDTTKPLMKASDVFVRALENEGVRYIFGVPGEENLDLLNSLRESSITFIVTRHEASAGFMAATYGRLTGKAGVCLSTLGPGATNLMTAAAYAQLGGMPMLLITGQKPIKKSKQGHFQIVPTTNLMALLTKLSKQIIHADAIPALIREALRLAEEERPGAVHLELPEDVAAEQTEAEPYPVHRVRRPIAEQKAIVEAVEMIKTARRPLLLIGAGANRKITSKMLAAFVEKTGIPFFNTQLGKGVLDERHPLFLGTTALSDDDFVHVAIRQSDLIINVGHDVIEKPPFIMRRDGTKVIHINFYSAKVDDVYFPQLEVIGDIGNALWQIKELLEPKSSWDFTPFLEQRRRFQEHLAASTDDPRFPVIPQRLVADVRAVMPEEGIVALDNGMYKLWFARNYPAIRPNTLLLDNALATMGAGLPSAIMAKLLHPDTPVLAVTGDGGFLMTVMELETAVRLHLNLTIMVLNDGGFGMIRWKQEAMGFPAFGLQYGNPDFVALAKSFGAEGYRVERSDDLKPMLQDCLAKPGVHVIDAPIDYAENIRVFTEELPKLTASSPQG